MKSFLAIFLLLFCSISYAYDNYVGYSVGVTTLNYDIKGEAYQWLTDDGGEYTSIISLIDGKIEVNADYQSTMTKFYFGHMISEHFSIGFMYFKMSPFSIDLTSKGDKTFYGEYTNAHGKVDAKFNSSIDLKGIGIKFEGIFPLVNNFGVVFGVGLLKAKSTIVTKYQANVEYNYSYNVPIDNPYPIPEEYKDSIPNLQDEYVYEDQKTGSSYDEIKAIIPVISFGFTYGITDNIIIRSEFERFGHPVDKMSIDVYSTGIQYNF
jgi:hypothetical protein